MKELIIEEKAKRYDEALHKAKNYYSTTDSSSDIKLIGLIFPELKESEDEKIRKYLIDVVNDYCKGSEHDGCIAWLEKRKEPELSNDLGEYIAELSKQFPEVSFAKLSRIAVRVKNWLEKQGWQKCWDSVKPVSEEDKLYLMPDKQKPADKVEPKFKVKYANSEYNVLKIKEIAGVTYYGIEDEPNHIDYVLPDNCEIINGYAIKENGCPYPTKPAVFSEQKPAETEKGVKRNDREIPFSEKEPYEGLTDFERTLADICIGWIGQELGWKQYIKDNANVLLKIAIKKLYSAQDVAFEQKPAELSQSEDTKTSDQVQKPAECRQETKPNGGIVYEDFNEGDGSYKVNLAYLSKPQVDLIEDLVASWQNPTNNTAEWSKEDEEMLKMVIKSCEQCGSEYAYYWLTSLKDRVQPKQEWSEEDVRNIQDIDSVLFYDKSLPEDTCMRLRNWLKSIRHQSHWKPSDEQMEALDIAQEELCSTEYNKPICDLIDSLNKLMEE